MERLRDAIHYLQLARYARQKADKCEDPDLARRLREAAIKNERMARRLKAEEGKQDKD